MYYSVEYSFDVSNKETIVFVPGYSQGLDSPVISSLKDVFMCRTGMNVFGVPMAYAEDTMDSFDSSQERLHKAIQEIAKKAPDSKITLAGKSIGGSLALFNAQMLGVTKIVILGPSVVLGWPQRISLLNSKDTILPDYKAEWSDMLMRASIPTLFLCGDHDDLTDNAFISQMAIDNPNIRIHIINDTNHSLTNINTREVPLQQLVESIDAFLES